MQNPKRIVHLTSKMLEEETKKRQEMNDHFSKAYEEISSKVQSQDDEYQQKKAENVVYFSN